MKVFFVNGIFLTLTSLIISTIAVSFNVYITNKVGSEAIGVYQLLMSVYMFFITLATSGIGLAATRIVAEELALNKEASSKRAISKCLFLSLAIGIVATFILIISAQYISSAWLHNKLSSTPIYLIAFTLPLISMAAALSGYFTAVRRVMKSASSQIIEQVIKIVITVYLINLFVPCGLENACIALVIGTLVSEIFSFIYLYIMYLFDKKRYNGFENVKSKHLKRILNITVPIALTSYIRSGLSTFKQIITPMRLEKSGIGCDMAFAKYGMISGMVLPILLFPSCIINSFSSMIMPEFARYYAKGDKKRINDVLNKIFKPAFLFSICIVGIFLTFAKEISISLYNNIETATYIKLLAPLVVVMYIDTVVDSILKGLNEQVAVMKYNIIDLVVSILCIYFLLPIMGINGYIIAIIVSECTNTFLSTIKLIKVTKFKINYKDYLIKPIFCMIFCGIALKLISHQMVTTNFSLIIQIFIFIIIYILFLYLISNISKRDFKL